MSKSLKEGSIESWLYAVACDTVSPPALPVGEAVAELRATPWQTVPEMLEDVFSRYADNQAVVDGEEVLTFQRLGALVEDVAAGMVSRNLEAGDRVVIWGRNSWRWAVAALACLRLGLLLVPVSAKLRGLETAPILAVTEARLVFFDLPAGRNYFDEMAGQSVPSDPVVVNMRAEDPGELCLAWKEFVDVNGPRPGYCVGLEPESPCEVLFTSGSTGRPKGVVLGHSQVLKPHWDAGEIHQYLETDRILITVSFSHNFGLNSGLLSSLMRGSTIVLTEHFASDVLADLIRSQAISLLTGPPGVIEQLLTEEQKTPGCLASVNQVAMASSVIPSVLIERLLALGVSQVATGYGMTECPLISCTRREDSPESIATSTGRAVPGISIQLVAENGSLVTGDEVGEVHVSGEAVMLGYYKDDALTRQAVDEEGWLRTGDLARWVDGDYLRLVGRKKEMFISQGFNVYPAEVENLLMQSGLLSNVAVVGKPSKLMGEEGVAYVVPTDSESFTVAQLRKWAAANIASFKVPIRFIIRASLPVNANGKIDKLAL